MNHIILSQDTVDRQCLVSHLMDALQKLKQTASTYTSKAALGKACVGVCVHVCVRANVCAKENTMLFVYSLYMCVRINVSVREKKPYEFSVCMMEFILNSLLHCVTVCTEQHASPKQCSPFFNSHQSVFSPVWCV